MNYLRAYPLLILSVFVLAGVLPLQAESDSEPRITSALADGTPAPAAPKKKKRKFKVLKKTQYQQDGRKVTIQEVEPPQLPKSNLQPKASELTSEEKKALLKKQQNALPHHFFTVSATTYDQKNTYLEVHDQISGKKVKSWSNLDWKYFGGMNSFEGRGQNFTYLLFQGGASLKELRQLKKKNPEIKVPKIPKRLPKLKKAGPSYVVLGKKAPPERVMEFLETIHELYAQKEKKLKKAHQGRVKQQKRRAEKLHSNPPKPKDIDIFYWKNSTAPKR